MIPAVLAAMPPNGPAIKGVFVVEGTGPSVKKLPGGQF